MISIFITFFTSLALTFALLKTQRLHSHLSNDNHLDGPQKFHKAIACRIGGLPIFCASYIGLLFQSKLDSEHIELLLLPACVAPVFAIGIAEDLTKRITPKLRLIFTAFGAGLSVYLLHTQVQHLGINYLNYLVITPASSIAFSIFAITGLSNAYNMIDGFHGLASMVAVITLASICYLALHFGDRFIFINSYTMIFAILGFFVFNYPRGLIFLGDGGAYLIGFWIAVLSILIVNRHPEISPFFALMVNAYPITEALFTIYRRLLHQAKNPSLPDGLHFHSLIFRRIMRQGPIKNEAEWFNTNSKTSPYLWILSLLSIIPAVFFWNSTLILSIFFVFFAILYVWLYTSIILYRTPKWLFLLE